MQRRACLLSVFSILVMTGTVTTIAAEIDPLKCTADRQWQDAFNKGDTSAVAALFTSDAVVVTPAGIRLGPVAVKKRLDEGIKAGWKQDLVVVVMKCDIQGAIRWSSGSWKETSPQGSSVSGFWTAFEQVKDGNGWKIQKLTYYLTLPGVPNYDIGVSQCNKQASAAAGITTKVIVGALGRAIATIAPVGAFERRQKFYDACMKASGFPNYEMANSQCTQQAIAKVPANGPPTGGLMTARQQIYDPCMKAKLYHVNP